MTKQETYDYLRAHGVDFEITEHKVVFKMEECADLHLPYPESEAKNLFIRDDKHAHYYLITVKGRQAGEFKGLPPRPRHPAPHLRLPGGAAGPVKAHPRLRHPPGAAGR